MFVVAAITSPGRSCAATRCPSPRIDTGQELKRVDDDLQRTLASIKEIEFDHASGHLSDEDFSTLDADERAKAIELMRERDTI